MVWTLAQGALSHGTQGLAALHGRRVRAAQALSPNRFDGAEVPMGAAVDIARRREGFIGHPVRDGVVLAFPERPPAPGLTLDQAMRTGRLTTVFVNEITFRTRFLIDL